MGQYCILIHYHELGLKKNNKTWFEKIFQKNIQNHLKLLPFKNINTYASRVFVFGIDSNRWDEYQKILKNIMGLKNATLMYKIDADLIQIQDASKMMIEEKEFNSFRISTKRQDKSFKHTSKELNQLVGETVQKICKKTVSLNEPDLNIIIEIVRGQAFIGANKIEGYGGLPNNTGETAISLLSSGIDSPVASFQILKRGVNIVYAHFHSSPATNKQSINNCKKIINTLSQFQLNTILYIYPLLKIQKLIMDKVPDKLWIIMFRRAMIRLSCMLAKELNAKALITGENIGQVSSQTLSNIQAISSASSLPIIRPLAGHNKEEIINLAKMINTYEDSIAPHQDCCAFFTPIHPELKAQIKKIEYIESTLHDDELYKKIIEKREVYQT
jgi:thiamine biosynthesis protein ThiI